MKKQDVENAIDELAQLTDKNFRRVDENTQRIEQNMATKKDLKKLERKQEKYKKDIIEAFKAYYEAQKADLEAAHRDELVMVEDKSKAPTPWQSMPRRLVAVEMDVEKIKDHLEIS